MWLSHVTSQTRRGVCPTRQLERNKSKEGLQGAGLQQGYSAGSWATGGRRDDETPQVTSITGDGRHMVTPCGFLDGHYKQAGYRRDTLQGVGLQEEGGMG